MLKKSLNLGYFVRLCKTLRNIKNAFNSSLFIGTTFFQEINTFKQLSYAFYQKPILFSLPQIRTKALFKNINGPHHYLTILNLIVHRRFN